MRHINWIAVRTAFVVQRWSAEKCAEQFGINPTTVKKKSAEEGWVAQRNRLATDATGLATEQIASESLAAVNAIREEHATLVRRMHDEVLNGIKEDLAAIQPGRSRIEARAKAAESYALVLKNSRLVLGITEGQSSMAEGQDSGERKIVFEEVEETA